MTHIPDIYVPLCPTCGDPVTSGCYPADGICAVEVEQCPHCASDRKDWRFVMPTVGAVTLADVAPCGNAWHDEVTR